MSTKDSLFRNSRDNRLWIPGTEDEREDGDVEKRRARLNRLSAITIVSGNVFRRRRCVAVIRHCWFSATISDFTNLTCRFQDDSPFSVMGDAAVWFLHPNLSAINSDTAVACFAVPLSTGTRLPYNFDHLGIGTLVKNRTFICRTPG